VKKLLAILIVLSAALAGVVVSDRPSPRADLTILEIADFNTLDPQRMSYLQDFRLAYGIYEGLVRLDNDTLAIDPAGAHAWELSEDFRTYTFHLVSEARWSNGDRVEATDFVRGWRRGMEPGTSADYSFLFTDRIVGAAEYVRWRTQGVGVLTALSRLARGFPIDPESAPRIAESAPFSTVAPQAGVNQPGPASSATEWHTWAERVSALPVDWEKHFRVAFQQHADEMDERFARVGLVATSPDTFVVRLTQPCPYFLDLTAFATMVPCHRSIERMRAHHQGRALTPEGLVVYDPQWTKPNPRDEFEIAERKEERLLQLGPALDRVQSEELQPTIAIVYHYMKEAGMLPPLPEESVSS